MTSSFDIRNLAFGLHPAPTKGNANYAWVPQFIQQHLNKESQYVV